MRWKLFFCSSLFISSFNCSLQCSLRWYFSFGNVISGSRTRNSSSSSSSFSILTETRNYREKEDEDGDRYHVSLILWDAHTFLYLMRIKIRSRQNDRHRDAHIIINPFHASPERLLLCVTHAKIFVLFVVYSSYILLHITFTVRWF